MLEIDAGKFMLGTAVRISVGAMRKLRGKFSGRWTEEFRNSLDIAPRLYDAAEFTLVSKES